MAAILLKQSIPVLFLRLAMFILTKILAEKQFKLQSIPQGCR